MTTNRKSNKGTSINFELGIATEALRVAAEAYAYAIALRTSTGQCAKPPSYYDKKLRDAALLFARASENSLRRSCAPEGA